MIAFIKRIFSKRHPAISYADALHAWKLARLSCDPEQMRIADANLQRARAAMWGAQ
jgi:hypothetical protein